jgi:hypothetical protein
LDISPFPAGNYVITYTVNDVPYAKNFKILKDIVIAGRTSNIPGNDNSITIQPSSSISAHY